MKHRPPHFHAVAPHLVVNNAAKAIDFYTRAFGAKEVFRMPGKDGRLMYAELMIDDSPLMLNDEFPEWGVRAPADFSPVTIHVFVPDVDATVAHAVSAGATLVMPAQDMFWGDRYAKLKDPFGHHWSVATKIKNLTPEEMRKAMAAAGC